MIALTLRVLACIAAAGIALYAYIDKTNELTELRIAIPLLTKSLYNLQEENRRLQYEIDRFMSPMHLMELQRKAEFSHLKFPLVEEEIVIRGNL